LFFELLEPRRLLTATATFSNGHLDIDGDSAANQVAVFSQDVSGTRYLIVQDGMATIFDGTPTGQNVAASQVQTIDADGAGGNDAIDLQSVNSSNGFTSISGVTIAGGDGDDILTGSDYADTLDGGAGADLLVGGAGADSLIGGTADDTLAGGAGNDTLSGGAGNDRFVFWRSSTTEDLGSDSVVDGSSIDNDAMDTLDFQFFLEGIAVNLGSTSLQTINSDLSLTLNHAEILESVVGSSGDDSITGNNRDNVILGLDGNDTINGGDGDDTLAGTNGNDSIMGGAGNDTISGGLGDDTLEGGAGDDLYNFDRPGTENLGTDTLIEASGANNDLRDVIDLTGHNGSITIDLSVAGTTQTIQTGALVIYLNADDSFEDVKGTDFFDDSITGNSRDNILDGNGGNDTICGLDGDDILAGDIGDDRLEGGAGNDWYVFLQHSPGEDEGSDILIEGTGVDNDLGDGIVMLERFGGVTLDLSDDTAQVIDAYLTITLNAGDAFEMLAGTSYDDVLIGNSRDNGLIGRGGNDSIAGNSGSDTLQGGIGNDTLSGGIGDDWYDFERLESEDLGLDVLIEGTGVDNDDLDVLDFGSFDSAVDCNLGTTSTQTILSGGLQIALNASDAFEGIVGSVYSDTLNGNSRDNYLDGGDGDDTLRGAFGDDTLAGGEGNDSYEFSRSSPTDNLGADEIIEGVCAMNDAYDGLVFLGFGEALTVDLTSTTVVSHTDLTITVNDSSSLEGVIGSSEADTIVGNARNNLLIGLGGNDTIFGGDGDDTLIGFTGDDSLSGGAGNDLYNFGQGTASNLGTDTLVEGTGANNDDGDVLDFTDNIGGVTINLGSTATQNVEGTNVRIVLNADDAFEYVFGSDYSDTITGNSRDNIIFGGGGNDSISGADGSDLIFGDDGNDTINGGNGSDIILGLAGADSITGDAGLDILIGGASADWMSGGADDDLLVSGDLDFNDFGEAISDIHPRWNDTNVTFSHRVADIMGTGPNPLPSGSRIIAGSTAIDSDSAADTLDGGSGDDWLLYDFGEDTVANGEEDTNIG
jgi:Ca2+-binding RTX toxin-like protein